MKNVSGWLMQRHLEEQRSENGAQNDAREAEEDPNQASDDRAEDATPGCAELLRAVNREVVGAGKALKGDIAKAATAASRGSRRAARAARGSGAPRR